MSTKQDADNGKAIEICMQEIGGSQPLLKRLLDSRYNWVPEPRQFRDTTIQRMQQGFLAHD